MDSKESLLKALSTTISKASIVVLANSVMQNKFPLTDLIDITFHENKKIAFRASWLLENILTHYADSYPNDELNYFFKRLPDVVYPSCQRHYANIAIRLTSSKQPSSIKRAIEQIDPDATIEKLFDWLIDPKVLVAVKSSAAEALLNMANRQDWIADELKNQLTFLMKDGSAAIQARGNRILKKLNRK